MKHCFLPEAELEYLDAVRFYEEKRAGLGLALIKEFETAITLIANNPQARRLIHPIGIRNSRLSRFLYSIFMGWCQTI